MLLRKQVLNIVELKKTTSNNIWVCLEKMLQTVPSLTWALNIRSNKQQQRVTSVCGSVPAGFLSSAWRTCQCTCWFPGSRCQPQWNLCWAKLAPVQEETWLTTPNTGANWSAFLRRPASPPMMGKRGWLTVRRERREEVENSWEPKTSPAWLVQLLNAVTLHAAEVVVCTMSGFMTAAKLWDFQIWTSFCLVFFTREAAAEVS